MQENNKTKDNGKAYNKIMFATAPRLKLKDIRIGMRVVGYQLDDIKDTYITIDNVEYVHDIINNTDLEGTITRISKDKNWKTSKTSVLVYNNLFDLEYWEIN